MTSEPQADAPALVLRLEGVSKRFSLNEGEAVVALDGIDLELRKGDFVTIVGSNGAGKSTLLNVISGAVPCDNGRVRIRGIDVTSWPQYRRAHMIAVVLQDPKTSVAPSLTVEENLAVALSRGKRRGLHLALTRSRRRGLQEQVSGLVHPLANRLRQSAGSLSGGERQMLAVVMASLAGADVLCLDEHCASLDPLRAPEVMAVTDAAIRNRGLTALMVTHNLELAVNYGNRLLVMHRGRIAVEITREERAGITAQELMDRFRSATGGATLPARAILPE